MINKIQTGTNQPSFKAWLELSGAKDLLSEKCIREITSSAEEIGDANDGIKIHIGDEYCRDNSWSEMRCRFTVPEYARTTGMSAIINGDHFDKSFETKGSEKGDSNYGIGFQILDWLETLPRYKD